MFMWREPFRQRYKADCVGALNDEAPTEVEASAYQCEILLWQKSNFFGRDRISEVFRIETVLTPICRLGLRIH